MLTSCSGTNRTKDGLGERIAVNGFWELIERIIGDEIASSTSKRIVTPFDDLTYKVIGCAMAVHRALGAGYRENTYQKDLATHIFAAPLH